MRKEEGAKTVVVGGKKDVTQQYCGTVGGQSTDYSTMDTEVKVCIFDSIFLSKIFFSVLRYMLASRNGNCV